MSLGPRRPVSTLLVTAALLAACSGGAEPDQTTSPVPSRSPSTSPTTDPSATTAPSASPVATATEDDTLVLAGQFTAFVGADGSGPACDAFWWADALGGQPYVGLSDTRTVTAAGRVEPLCLLGFDGVVELTVTDPFGAVESFDLDATEPDGGIGVLEVALAGAPSAGVVLAAWQADPSAPPSTAPSPSEPAVVAQDATTQASPGPSEPSTDEPTTPETQTEFTESEEFDDVDESEDDQEPAGVRLEWAVPPDARGQYSFVARQGGLVGESVVTVVAPTRLEVGPEAEGTRVVTMRDGQPEPAPVGLYRIEDEFGEFADADGFRGRAFTLVEDLGTLANGASTTVATADLEPGRYCVTSPAVQFVDCRPDDGSDAVPGSGWVQ